jgi:(4S)-4-hydroxy-5-phosphonooxypentane-2,3-dione isomerase
MQVIFVHVQVKPEYIEQFKALCIDNASNSVQEPGIARFDVVQNVDDPTRFVLIEAYRNADAPGQHKATAHYARWRDGATGMMAEPRSTMKYESVFLPD